MKSTASNRRTLWTLLPPLAMLLTFFCTWVEWDKQPVSGSDMPLGNFFSIAELSSGLSNPFPQFDFFFPALWVIPLLIVTCLGLHLRKRGSLILAGLATAMSLAIVTLYYLFSSRILVDLGSQVDFKISIYVFTLAAIVFLLSHSGTLVKKLGWLLVGPVFAGVSFMLIENYLKNKTHADTVDVRVDYTLTAGQLMKEFANSDTAANRKYLDKVMVVDGPVSAADILSDSTSTIRFTDSTGSYAIFSLEKSEYEHVKGIKPGHHISLKGVCSGSIYSDILGTTSISFKRAIINRKIK